MIANIIVSCQCFFKQRKYFLYICWIFNNERVRQTHYAIVKADQFGNFDNCSAVSLINACLFRICACNAGVTTEGIRFIIDAYLHFSAYISFNSCF